MKGEFKFNLIFDEQGKDLQRLIDELLLETYIIDLKKYGNL